MFPRSLFRILPAFTVAGLLGLPAALLPAQGPVRRLAAVPSATESRIALSRDGGSRHHDRAELQGALPGETALAGMSLVLKPTDAQDAALSQLLLDQANPASPSFQQWLTPEQFGARFGVADADLTILQNWLQSRGFTVNAVAGSRNRITFSGTASAVESAFGVRMQQYRRGGQTFYENANAVQMPASLTSVVGGVTGLSSYRLPAPQQQRVSTAPQAATATPDYTSSSGNHYIVPWDFRQIFGINTLISAGFNGTGIKIGVIGQSAVDATQLTYFQQKTGQTVSLPTMVLVPNTSASAKVSGDEEESELDLEYASGSAPGASIQFIYTGCANATTGNCNNNGVFDALSYAITSNLAPILTLSYGGCEAEDASYATSTLEPLLRQANAQGQTILVSSGDFGAAGCETSASPKTAVAGLAVSYPASSAYVTAVGGTQLNSDSSTYWSSTNNSSLGSAIGYIPEIAWNDTSAYGSLSSTGGGVSKIFGKPSWQTGTGVPSDGHRDVPDVAFPASVTQHAYLICDAYDPCTSGTQGFTLSSTGRDGGGVGGTSASAPTFAAMLAVIEQANGAKALGNINPSLYALAAGTTGSGIFHDITSGSNIVPCTTGTTDCTTGSMGYAAAAGYDLVTGLGSIAAPALLTGIQSISTASSNKLTPTILLTATTTNPIAASAVGFSVYVSGNGATPTGTVTFAVDGAAPSIGYPLAGGSASYTQSSGFTTGSHTIVAAYSGDGTYQAASNTLTLTVAAANSSITMSSSPSTLTISAGTSGSEGITLVSNGYAGPLSFKATLTSATSSSFPYCLSITPVTLSAGLTQTATLTVNTASNCASTGTIQVAHAAQLTSTSLKSDRDKSRHGIVMAALSCGVLVLSGLRRRRPSAALLALVAAVIAVGMSGCGSGTSTSSSTTTTGTGGSANSTTVTGTYGLRISASSSTNSAIGASTDFTLVVR